MVWGTASEREIYLESVRRCLDLPRVKARLEARQVARTSVFMGMEREDNACEALEPYRGSRQAWFEAVVDAREWSRVRFGAVQARADWNTRTAVFYGTLLLLLGCWIAGAPLLAVAAVLAAGFLPSLYAALRDPDSRAQLGCWAVLALHLGLRGLLAPAVALLGRWWLRGLTRDGTGPVLEAVVDQLLGDDPDALLLPEGYEGLRSVHGAEYVVTSATAAQLKQKIDRIDGGTIAVSGPRGVGKTTLLEGCVRGADFSVFVQAPATYAPHEFLISLFVRVCEEYLETNGYDAPQMVRSPGRNVLLRRTMFALKRFLRWFAYVLPAAALICLGLVATVRSLQAEHGAEVADLASGAAGSVRDGALELWHGDAAKAAFAVTLLGIFLWTQRSSATAARVVRFVWRAAVVVVACALLVGPFVSLGFDPEVTRNALRLLSVSFLVPAVALLILWLLWRNWLDPWLKPPIKIGPVRFDLEEFGPWEIQRRRLAGPVRTLFALAALALLSADDAGWAILSDSENTLRLCVWLLGIVLLKLGNRSWLPNAEPRLVTECRNRLYRLQTVQGSSSGLTTGGAVQLFTLGTTHSSSLSTLPPSYPELVADFRELVTRMAQDMPVRGRRFIIAIDEVDRLGTDTEALAFLREIKAILGVPRVHYLISVAEDVGAAFVRRGLPHRDVTDSSFDDVVHVQAGVLAESVAILDKRAPELTGPYALLAHTLAGGLPRDLIRYGRRLIEIQETTEQVELVDISQDMILEELSETLAGFRTLLAKQQWSPQNSMILGSFRTLTGLLRTVDRRCPACERELQQALEHFALHSARDTAQPDVPALPDGAGPLIDEAAAYAYFSFTLLGIFGRENFNERKRRAKQRGPDGETELLAEARRELAVSPYSARTLIDAIRLAWDLRPADEPPVPAVVPAPRTEGSCARHASA